MADASLGRVWGRQSLGWLDGLGQQRDDGTGDTTMLEI